VTPFVTPHKEGFDIMIEFWEVNHLPWQAVRL
jgi:hypothetical protein